MAAVQKNHIGIILSILTNKNVAADASMSDGKTALMLASSFPAFDILVNSFGKPKEGWDNWVKKAIDIRIDVIQYLSKIINDYINFKLADENKVSALLHRIFGQSSNILQAKILLQLIKSINSPHDLSLIPNLSRKNICYELRELFQLYLSVKRISVDLKLEQSTNKYSI